MLTFSVRLVPHTLCFTDPSRVFIFAHLLGERSAQRCWEVTQSLFFSFLHQPAAIGQTWVLPGLFLCVLWPQSQCRPARPSLCPLQFPGCQSGSKPKPLLHCPASGLPVAPCGLHTGREALPGTQDLLTLTSAQLEPPHPQRILGFSGQVGLILLDSSCAL